MPDMLPHPRSSLRPATSADAPALAAVFDAAVRESWPHQLGALADEPLFAPADWDALVADHGDDLVVGCLDGELAGFCAVHPSDGELFLLFVHPDAAGRGVGRRLLAAGHERLRGAGWSAAHLWTQEANARARAVYAAAGYRPDGLTRASDFRGVTVREVRLFAPL